MTTNDEREWTIGRRTVLRTTAAGSVAGLGAVSAAAQDDGPDIELGGRISAWMGVAPEEIADERNPTLELVAGQDYLLVWENLDGATHNFVIVDENDEPVVESELMTGSGETQEVEFTAEEGMVEYFCDPHRTSMVGDVEIVEEGAGGGGEQEQQEQLIGEGPTVGLETVAEGLASPLDLQVADEETDRRFVVDQTGQIYVHGSDGLEDEPFLDVSDQLVEFQEGFDERGLLGLAFHPEFAENGRFFVRYSAPPREETPEEYDHTFVLSEFQTADDENASADPDSERTILEIPEPQFNHNAGPIRFGPDGYLYVATGDGGGGNDTGTGHVEDWYDENDGGNGQDTAENLLGGILRIDVDGEGDGGADGTGGGGEDGDGGDGRAYAIPDDNPLVDQDGQLGEYYAWGLRNPWGMSFTEGGDLLAADVGQELYEEVDHVEAGENYGWNVKEGTHCFSTESPTEPPEECPDSTPEDVRGGEELRDPVIEYPHERDGEPVGVSVVGGYLYEGEDVDSLDGTYVFGDWSVDGQGPGRLFLARPPEGWPDGGDGESTEGGGTGGDGDEGTGGGPEDTFVGPPGEDEEEATPTEDGLWPIEELQLELVTGEQEVDVGPDEDAAGEEGGNATDDAGNATDDAGNATGGDLNETDDAGNASGDAGNASDGDANVTDAETNATGDDGNVTDAETNATGDGENVTDAEMNATDDGGNVTDGDANATGDEPDANGAGDAGDGDAEDGAVVEDGELTQLVYGFGRDAEGELYVLTSGDPSVTGESGAVHRIHPQQRSIH